MADQPSRSPSPDTIAPPIRSIADYLRASARGPFGWIAWTKFLLLLAVGILGVVLLFTTDDLRSLVIGSTLTLLGFLGAAAVWILSWVLIAHDAQLRALRTLESRLRGATAD